MISIGLLAFIWLVLPNLGPFVYSLEFAYLKKLHTLDMRTLKGGGAFLQRK